MELCGTSYRHIYMSFELIIFIVQNQPFYSKEIPTMMVSLLVGVPGTSIIYIPDGTAEVYVLKTIK